MARNLVLVSHPERIVQKERRTRFGSAQGATLINTENPMPKLTGTLAYDPVAYATGRARTNLIKRQGHRLHTYLVALLPWLTDATRRHANQAAKVVHDDPYYWLRDQPPEAAKVSRFFDLCQRAAKAEVKPPGIHWRRQLAKAVSETKRSLILTRREKGWAILVLDPKAVAPHLKQLRQRGVSISPSIWGPHCSVVRGERVHPGLWKTGDQEQFTIEVDTEIQRNRAGYFWLKARSPELERIRQDMELPSRPRPDFHLTIGKAHK